MDKNKWSYSYSWTQPYPNWQSWTPPQIDPYNESMMDTVEEKLQAMTAYPDAEAIIQKVKHG
jgi:hypothetical protein